MGKNKIIPVGFMRVGELAKKMGITVRTLQYYDQEGLLSPSSESEGGFRLYTDKDMVKLIQIQTMKQLGFTLSEIKKRLVSLDTPSDMINALSEHETVIEKEMETLAVSLKAIKALKAEVTQIQTMDFRKYADILINLQMKNENYWAIKYMDDDVLNHLRNHFENDEAGALAFMETINQFGTAATQLLKDGVLPDSEKGQSFAKMIWNTMLEVTGGDENLITKFAAAMETEDSEKIVSHLDNERVVELAAAHDFMLAALDVYFINLGHESFENGG